MILPPRIQDHRRLDRPDSASERRPPSAPLPPRDDPHRDRFAVPPWDRRSPERLAIDDDLTAGQLARAIDEAGDRLDLTDLLAS